MIEDSEAERRCLSSGVKGHLHYTVINAATYHHLVVTSTNDPVPMSCHTHPLGPGIDCRPPHHMGQHPTPGADRPTPWATHCRTLRVQAASKAASTSLWSANRSNGSTPPSPPPGRGPGGGPGRGPVPPPPSPPPT